MTPPPPPPPPPVPPPPLPPAPPPGPAFDVDALKARYVEAVRDEVETYAGGCMGALVVAAAAGAALTIVLLPWSIRIFTGWRLARRTMARPLREALRFAEAAVPVMAYPLMVNSSLRQPGDDGAPGLFLICFERGRGDSLAYMGQMALTVGGGEDDPHLTPADREFCRALMADEDYVPFRRRRVPASITGGPAVYACDVAIQPGLLFGRHISDEMPLVPCMAEPGERGRIVQMPYWMLAGRPGAKGDEEKEFMTSLLSVSKLAEAAGTGS